VRGIVLTRSACPAHNALMKELAADSCHGMAKKPKPSTPISGDIYQVARKSVRLGTVKAPDKHAAIQKGAQEFKAEVWRLYAVQR
jgi:hypothetical protein